MGITSPFIAGGILHLFLDGKIIIYGTIQLKLSNKFSSKISINKLIISFLGIRPKYFATWMKTSVKQIFCEIPIFSTN